jgi:hypothetical protein
MEKSSAAVQIATMATVLENSMRLHQLLLGRFNTFVGKGADREVRLLKDAIGDAKRRGFGRDHLRVQAVQKALKDVEALIESDLSGYTLADTMGLGRKGV